MLLPPLSFSLSVRIVFRCASVVNSVPSLCLIASANVSVMSPATSFVAAPLPGLNSGADTPVVSTVNVAFSASPWLPATS